MEKLKRVVVLIGDADVGKSTILNLYVLLKNHRSIYYEVKNRILAGQFAFSNTTEGVKFITSLHKDKYVSFDKTYSHGDRFRRVAVVTAGDSQEMIKYAFEFAESTESAILVLACRTDEKIRGYLKLKCRSYGIEPRVLEIQPAKRLSVRNKDIWRYTERIEELVRSESAGKKNLIGEI